MDSFKKAKTLGKDHLKLHNYCFDNNNNTKICLGLPCVYRHESLSLSHSIISTALGSRYIITSILEVRKVRSR